MDEFGRVKHAGTRRAVCFNNDIFYNASKNIVEQMAKALGSHEQLVAWQVDSGLGGHQTEWSFNEDSRLEWQNWLKLKYKGIDNLNNRLGLRFWGQIAASFEDVAHAAARSRAAQPRPAPRLEPFLQRHDRGLRADAGGFAARNLPEDPRDDQPARIAKEVRPFRHGGRAGFRFRPETNAAIKAKSCELACDIDMLRSLKKNDTKTPDGDTGFWVIEQKAGQVNWQDVNPLVRPGIIRLFTYQLVSRGACGILYYRWRQPRIGSEKFAGAVLPHNLGGSRRTPTMRSPRSRRGIENARAGPEGHPGRRRNLHPLFA